jgi:hypothetical protein
MLIGLSQVLNGSAAKPEALARALILDGQERLRALRKAAPHLDLSLDRLLSRICSNETMDEQLSEEESAIQAVLEMYLGLILRWLSKSDDWAGPRTSSVVVKPLPPLDVLLMSLSSSPHLLFRARSCLIS